jgi:hypothetical protein
MNPQMRSLEHVRHLAGTELSLKARLAHVALLLVSLAMTAVIASLWLTEPLLPLRTQIAFGVMTLIGLGWSAFSIWVLRARRPLYARDRVIAGRMAVTFTAVFVAGAIAMVAAGNAAAIAMLALGVVMLAAAVRILSNARHRFATLNARRAELERP